MADNEHLKKCAQAIGGVFLKSPIWNKVFHHGLITVHPLGGCAMERGRGGAIVIVVHHEQWRIYLVSKKDG